MSDDAKDGGTPNAADSAVNPLNEAAEFTENLTKAWTKGQEAWQKMLAAQMHQGASATPQQAFDPFNLAPAYGQFMQAMAAHPERFAQASADLWTQYAALWQTSMAQMTGGAMEAGSEGDKRFDDPMWRENAVFNHLKQSYLLTSNWMRDTVASADDMPEESARKLKFFTERYIESLSPTNFFATNPAALRETVDSHGANLVKGMESLLKDIERGGGSPLISQTDMAAFKVGENVADTPGHVIYQNDLIQVIQYEPTTAEVCARPVLILPPWINKFYIMDLNAQKSMVRWLVEQGHAVFLVSWKNPIPGCVRRTFDDYIHEGFMQGLEVTLAESGADKANVVGYCIGGTMVATALAHMAKMGDNRIASATFFTAQTDFVMAGELKALIDEPTIKMLEDIADQDGGVLKAQNMAQAFNMMRGSELIWNFVVNNYYMGKDPRAFDMLYWNADSTNMPGGVHVAYLRDFYIANKLACGDYTVDGEPVSLADVRIPVYSVAAREDHIAPAESVFRGAKLFGGPMRFVVAGSGHIAGIINPPAKRKYQYWTNPAPVAEWPETLEEWLGQAEETAGSWWPDWDVWLNGLSGEKVPAKPVGSVYAPIEPAPGSYVKERSDALDAA